jgi:hypothetical protein
VENGGTPHTEDAEQGTTSNVVRLPRDWLGPREDLVPFGSAESDEAPAPPRAEDFWGESSAAVQDAWSGPVEADPEPAPLPGVDPAAAVRPTAAPPTAAGPARGRARRRIASAAAAVAVAAVIAGVVAIEAGTTTSRQPTRPARLASDSARPPSRAVRSNHSRPAQSRAGHEIRHVSARHRGLALGGSVELAAHQVVLAARARANSWKVTAARQRAARTASSEFVSHTASTGTQAATGSADAVASAATSSPPPAASSTESSSPGPSGPGATFGPGHLG